MAETPRRDAAGIEKQYRVINLTVSAPWRAKQNSGTAIRGFPGELANRGFDRVKEEGLRNQVAGGIPGYRKLRADHQIRGPGRRFSPRRADTVDVRRYRTDSRIELGQCDGDAICHGASVPWALSPAKVSSIPVLEIFQKKSAFQQTRLSGG